MLKYLPEKRNIITNRGSERSIILTLSFICILLACGNRLNAQVYGFGEKWYAGAAGGMVSFFGDLSTKDYNPVWKTQTESDLGLSLEVGKDVSTTVGISASLSLGKMKGNNPDLNYYFNSKFNELQLMLNLNLRQLVFGRQDSPLDIYLGAGGGYLNFQTIRRQMDNGNIVTDEGFPAPGYSGSNRSAMFFSAGPAITYSLNENWKAITSLVFRFTDSDLLDSHAGSTRINDRYSMLLIGARYYFDFSGNSGNRTIRCTEEYKKFKRRN